MSVDDCDPKPAVRHRLSTVEEAQRAMPRLIRAVNDDPRLALAALANPLFAIEELGYSIDEGIRTTFERRIRFTPEQTARLERLAIAVGKAAGRDVDVDDPYDLARLLFDELKLPRPASSTPRGPRRNSVEGTVKQKPPSSIPTAPLDPRVPWISERRTDPLAELAGRHPVMKPLLEYRDIDASEPRLASPEAYRRARDETTSVTNVSFRRHTERKPAKQKKQAKQTKRSG